MALWMKHSEKTTQGEGGRSCWTCLNILCIYFQRIKLPYRSKKKKRKMRGAACSCLECEMFVLRSAVAPWQRVLNWLQMCEESEVGGLCSSRSWGCKATFTVLNWHHVSPRGGREVTACQSWCRPERWFSMWGIHWCVFGGIEQRQSCGWKFPDQFHLSLGVCTHEHITFPILTFW